MLVRYQAALRPDAKRKLVYHPPFALSRKRMKKMQDLQKKAGKAVERGGMPACGLLPPPLKEGGCIAVVAPAGTPDPGALELGLTAIRSRGYALKVAEQVYMKDAQGFAGSDRLRAEALMDAFQDTSVDAIWMARGGYGSMRIFPFLDSGRIRRCPKRFMGFSDGTALLAFFWKCCGIMAFHGPVLTQMGRLLAEDQDAAFDALISAGTARFAMPCPRVLQRGTARGRLFGGNLTLLCHLLGTPYFPDLSGALLFIEDIHEAPYRIDRMICHLAMAGVLDGIAGLLLGGFTECGEAEEIHARILYHLPSEIPVVCALPVGHGESNRPLVFGAPAFLDADAGRLVWGGRDV